MSDWKVKIRIPEDLSEKELRRVLELYSLGMSFRYAVSLVLFCPLGWFELACDPYLAPFREAKIIPLFPGRDRAV